MPDYIELEFDDDINKVLRDQEVDIHNAMLSQIMRDVQRILTGEKGHTDKVQDKLRELKEVVSKKNASGWYRVSVRRS